MDISIKTVEQVTVVDLAGDVDANTAPTVQEGFTASPGSKILLDMLRYPICPVLACGCCCRYTGGVR